MIHQLRNWRIEWPTIDNITVHKTLLLVAQANANEHKATNNPLRVSTTTTKATKRKTEYYNRAAIPETDYISMGIVESRRVNRKNDQKMWEDDERWSRGKQEKKTLFYYFSYSIESKPGEWAAPRKYFPFLVCVLAVQLHNVIDTMYLTAMYRWCRRSGKRPKPESMTNTIAKRKEKREEERESEKKFDEKTMKNLIKLFNCKQHLNYNNAGV